ncbi:MAG TPA: hypothetical protein VGI74_23185, partial [Streptosporangiaceae bacterium]
SPIIPLYVIHVGTTWLLTWLFMQGPLRVMHLRWRFEGGKVLTLAPGRLRRRYTWPNTAADGTAEAAAAGTAGAGAAAVAAGTAAATIARQGPGEAARRAVVAAGPAVAAEPATLAEGVLCGNGHFSHPQARYCVVCGSAVLPLTGPRRVGRRPPAGILILTDGRTMVVDHDLTVTASGPSGDLGFLPVGEHPRTVARIKLIGWQPVVTSLVSSMSLVLPGGSSMRIEPNVPAPLVPGAELALGAHRIRYESPHYGWYASLTPDASAHSPGLAVAGEAKPGWAVPQRRRLAAPLAAAAGIGTLSGIAAGRAAAASRMVVRWLPRPGRHSRRAAAAGAVTAALVAATLVGFAGRIADQHGGSGQLAAGPAPTPTSGPAAPGTQPSHAGERPGGGVSTDGSALTAATSARTRGRPPHQVPTSTPPGPPSSPPTQPPTSPPAGSPSPTPTPTRTQHPGSCPVKVSLGPVKLRVCLPPVLGEL